MQDLEPTLDCSLCDRLAGFREENCTAFPSFHNAPVPSFGSLDARLLIVGLAPGLKGANQTGRPFTGDYAGDLLYATLLKFGFATGQYGAIANDGLRLQNTRITNAVRCVPPQNKPVGAEVKNCRPFLTGEIGAMAKLEIILALGTLAHNAVLASLGHKQSAAKFGHGAYHPIGDGRHLHLADSYHCSRYNTNTGRLTEDMFCDIFRALKERLAT